MPNENCTFSKKTSLIDEDSDLVNTSNFVGYYLNIFWLLLV